MVVAISLLEDQAERMKPEIIYMISDETNYRKTGDSYLHHMTTVIKILNGIHIFHWVCSVSWKQSRLARAHSRAQASRSTRGATPLHTPIEDDDVVWFLLILRRVGTHSDRISVPQRSQNKMPSLSSQRG